MGCWNNTCGLTNLPIFAGDPVYVFPVVDNSHYRSHCYTSGLYKPCLTPFEAKYNDYGAGEDESGVALEFIVVALKSQILDVEQGENSYHDIAVNKDDFDIDLFWNAVHKHRLKLKNPYLNDPNIYFTMIRKSVADEIFNNWKFDVYTGKGKGTDPDDYYERDMTYRKIAEELPQYLEFCIDGDGFKHRYRLFSDSEDFMVSRYFTYLSSRESWNLLFLETACTNLVKDNKKDLVLELMTETLKGYAVDAMMGNTRKVWLPVMHQGSQDDNLDDYLALNKIIQSEIEKELKDREDW